MDSQIAIFQFWVCYVKDTSLIDSELKQSSWSRLCEATNCTECINGYAFYVLMRLFIQHDDYILLCFAAKV